MANKVTVVVKGGRPKVLDSVATVADIFKELELEGNYSATINGEPAKPEDSLQDYEYVTLAESVKGGC